MFDMYQLYKQMKEHKKYSSHQELNMIPLVL